MHALRQQGSSSDRTIQLNNICNSEVNNAKKTFGKCIQHTTMLEIIYATTKPIKIHTVKVDCPQKTGGLVAIKNEASCSRPPHSKLLAVQVPRDSVICPLCFNTCDQKVLKS